jgi:hypothetical protein
MVAQHQWWPRVNDGPNRLPSTFDSYHSLTSSMSQATYIPLQPSVPLRLEAVQYSLAPSIPGGKLLWLKLKDDRNVQREKKKANIMWR